MVLLKQVVLEIICRGELKKPTRCVVRTGEEGVRHRESGMPLLNDCGKRMPQIPPRVPLDPELFVASQPIAVPFANPWSELARARSRAALPARRCGGLSGGLRSELKREVGRAERLIRRGREISEVLSTGGRISPLGCFIVAVRAGRGDLADRFAASAAAQHRTCPLCRQASLALLPADLYPAAAHFAGHEVEL